MPLQFQVVDSCQQNSQPILAQVGPLPLVKTNIFEHVWPFFQLIKISQQKSTDFYYIRYWISIVVC